MRSQSRRLWLLVILIASIVAVSATSLAGAHSDPVKHKSHNRCDQHPHPSFEQRKMAKQVFDYHNWKSPKPGKGAVKTMKVLRGCAEPPIRKKMAASWKFYKADLYLQQRYRRVATEPGFDGEGRFMQWLSIPKYIVECESRGYGNVPGSKGPRMTAYNPSGAEGPAQLLGWDNPWPVITPLDNVEYWEEAAYVMSVQGSGAWECA